MRPGGALLGLMCAACLESPGGAAGADAATATDGETGDGSNLVVNGDFETGVAGWEGWQADIGAEPAAHAGDGAAWVCLDGDLDAGTLYGIDVEGPVLPDPAEGLYTVAAWVRASDGASAQMVDASIRLTSGVVDTSPPVTVADDWKRIVHDAELVGDGALSLRIGAEAEAAGDCFVVDEVVLSRR